MSGLVAALVVLASSAGASAGPEPGQHEQAAAITADGSFQHGTVAVDGGSLHYVRAGSGPPLVLLHGWPQTWWAWHDVIPELAQEHTVLAFDLPGLGSSFIPADGYEKAATARRIRQAVQRLGFQQVEIIGHDIGALVAYPYARDYPSEVTRLAVIETPLSGFGMENIYGLSWHFRFNLSPAPLPERILDTDEVPLYHGMIFDFSANREAIDRSKYFSAYSSPARRTAGYNYYRAFPADAADNQANAVAKRLPMPVLAMGAQFSFGPGVAASFQQVASDVRQVVAPDAGHFVPEENPRFVIDCVKLFFGATSGPPPPALAACAA
ncbi:MAG TPA: alpha/beta fold hydrolase [Pilimelia sp.]|nr:alpha/beta fold hydrolase [Pilimelia sp.]